MSPFAAMFCPLFNNSTFINKRLLYLCSAADLLNVEKIPYTFCEWWKIDWLIGV